MRKIRLENIIKITDTQLIFFDERGNTDYIDLDECAQNFADVYHKSFLNKTDLKCVGERLLYGEYVYFEFYAKEHV